MYANYCNKPAELCQGSDNKQRKRIRPLRELYKLAIMMATCFRALLWCFLLCFVVRTVWAMLIVEVVSPFVKESLSLTLKPTRVLLLFQLHSSVLTVQPLVFSQ